MKLKIWLDDLREAPNGYKWCHSVNETIAVIEENKNNIEAIDLDHDLGDFAKDGGDAIRYIRLFLQQYISDYIK